MPKLGENAYWHMIQGDLGCPNCKHWIGDRYSAPCFKYNVIEVRMEQGCPYWEHDTEERATRVKF